MLFTAFIVLIWCSFHTTDAHYSSEENGQKKDDFNRIFENAKRDYLDGQWNSCAQNLLLALEDFDDYARGISQCYQICSQFDAKDLIGVVTKGKCLKECKGQMRPRNATLKSVKEFVDLKPYEFLQVCAFKIANVTLAASAAYTYYLLHKTDDIMLNNIHFYRVQKGVTIQDFVNLEESKFVIPYITGAIAYTDQDWPETIEQMELATGMFYEEFSRCEALCEEIHVLDRDTGFHEALAAREVAVLTCCEACFTRLTEIRTKVIADVVSDMYNYLQFAYFKVGRVHSALQCADTFLIFKPDDEDMINNKNYYVSSGAVSTGPRLDGEWFHQRMKWITTTLADVEEHEDKIISKLEVPPNFTSRRDFRQLLPTLPPLHPADCQSCQSSGADCSSQNVCRRADVIEVDAVNKRLLVGDVMAEGDVKKLLAVMKQFGLKRSIRNATVTSNSSVDDVTVREAVENVYDLSLDRVVMLHRIGKLDLPSLRLILASARAMKRLVDVHLSPDTETFIRTVRLVGYTTKLKSNHTQTASIPWAREPCTRLQESGLCFKKGAYQNDSFLASLYLNQDFYGGQTTLENFLQNSKRSYTPVRGQMLAFSSLNEHEVSSLQPGARYTVFLTLTGDRNGRGISYAEADALAKYPARREHPHTGPAAAPHSVESRGRVVQALQKEGVSVEELGVWSRLQADGLASQDQCNMLMNLAKVSLKNDGYTPGSKEFGQVHTEHEYFSGLTIDSAAKLAEKEEVSQESVRLYQNLSDFGRSVVQRYFQLKTPLYFDYTHLVCRTAKNDSNKDREDLSHPIHSDNCIIYSDGSCKRESPAYTERDFSAIIYLNDDFDGGEFLFTNPKPAGKHKWTVEAEVKPRCGRLVGFRADDYHGVRAVLSGRRCALALWFTLDPYYREKAHTDARRIMKKLETASGNS